MKLSCLFNRHNYKKVESLTRTVEIQKVFFNCKEHLVGKPGILVLYQCANCSSSSAEFILPEARWEIEVEYAQMLLKEILDDESKNVVSS